MTEKEAKLYEATLRRLRHQYPCRGCKYYAACGDPNRTRKCEGRKRMVRRKLIVRAKSGVWHLAKM